MDPGPARDALTFVAGIGTGMLSAAFGVGGAVVSTPAIRALGASAILSIGTTLPSVLPSAVSGTARYAREHLIDWRVVRWTAPTGVVAAVGGSVLSNVVPGDGHWLMLLTAFLLAFTGWRMTRNRPASFGGAELTMPRREPSWLLSTIGASAGLLSGLLGVGGGILMVPAFTEVCRVPIKRAVATSLACVGIFAVPGTLTHWALGDIDWRFALWLGVGVVPGARLGAAAAIRSTDRRLRLTVAVFLGAISVVYAAGEVASLLNSR